ncbi:MAG: hypothetical protein JWP38_910 [Herbaspirillum sp.]|nr:hypothetical protein [Herbaspirillum sp.]
MTTQQNQNIAPAPTAATMPSSEMKVAVASTSQQLVIYLAIGIVEYRGTSAMLEDEGIIPANFKWPIGYGEFRWASGKFKYWLRRKRPEGAKGPRKDFFDCDYWHLRCAPVVMPDSAQSCIANKAKDLADAIYWQSPKGRAEWYLECDRCRKALKDEKYQAFKALIPGLAAPKRGRPSKTITQQGAAE